MTLEKQRSEENLEEYNRKRIIIMNDKNINSSIKSSLLYKLTKKYYPLRDPENEKNDLELLKEFGKYR